MPPWSDILVLLGVGAAFVYDFRTYSLLLLGLVLIACGTRLLRISTLIGASASDVRGPAVRALLAVLALVAPLIPIQAFFALPLCAIAVFAPLLVMWRIQPAARPPERALVTAAG